MDKPAPAKILIVDDRAERRLTLGTILEPLQQQLIFAASGREALRELLREDVAVILLDVHMPVIDGFETAQLIRERPRSSHTPIIFVTGSQEWEDIERAYSMGAVDFISVPVNPCVLRAKVGFFVELFKMADCARREGEARVREEQARARAEAENKAKDEFLANLSHELRTPLTPILATIQELEHDPDPVRLRQSLHVMRRNLELEARLIDDLLDLTRIRTGKLRLQREVLNIHNALKRAAEICHPKAACKQLEFSMELSASESHVEGDAARLQQAFWNLINNAIKFTPDKGRIVIRTTDSGPRRVHIEVEDSGIGIAPHELGRIFDRFAQTPEGTTQKCRGGLGLGLAIAKSLVEAHGGQIWAHSAGQNKGSSFHIALPTTSAPQEEETAACVIPARASTALRILLVDDHQDTREALQRLLVRKGYSVEVAGDVASAIHSAENCTFDLLISDIGLPDGSGMDIMRHLRERSQLPGIALSGFGMESDIAQSKEAGFLEHLIKPVNFTELHTVIERQFPGSQSALSSSGGEACVEEAEE